MKDYKIKYNFERNMWQISYYCLKERERLSTNSFKSLKDARDYVYLLKGK